MKPQKIKILKIDGEYSDFHTFYEKNKRIIYDSILESFDEFNQNDKIKHHVLQLSNVNEEDGWYAELDFKKEDYIILKRDLMPYYEKIEDYEKCSKIIELDKRFTSSK